jgi:hypothetical protein
MGPAILMFLGVLFLSGGIYWHFYNPTKHISSNPAILGDSNKKSDKPIATPSTPTIGKEQKMEPTKEQQQLIRNLIKEYDDTHPVSERTAQLAQHWVNNKLKEQGHNINITLSPKPKTTAVRIGDNSNRNIIKVGSIIGYDQAVEIYRSEDNTVTVDKVIGPKRSK